MRYIARFSRPGRKNGCGTVKAHRCVVLLLQHCVRVLLMCNLSFNVWRPLTCMIRVTANSAWNTCWTYRLLLLLLISSLMMAPWCRNMWVLAPDMKLFLSLFYCILVSTFCWFFFKNVECKKMHGVNNKIYTSLQESIFKKLTYFLYIPLSFIYAVTVRLTEM
jgi:hypothetical protein